MKEYSKPSVVLIKFSAKDVLVSSASGFDISWLNIVPDNGGLQ